MIVLPRHRYLEDGRGPSLGDHFKNRPLVCRCRNTLLNRCHTKRIEAGVIYEMESAQMDGNRLRWMIASGMLGGVGVDGELVGMTSQHRIGVLDTLDLGEEIPALRRRIEVSGVDHLGGRQSDAASRTFNRALVS